MNCIANNDRILFGILYWYVWTRLLPRLGAYKLEEEVDRVDDGSSIIKLVRSYYS